MMLYFKLSLHGFRNNIWKQAGAELCQAQVKLGLAKIEIAFQLTGKLRLYYICPKKLVQLQFLKQMEEALNF